MEKGRVPFGEEKIDKLTINGTKQNAAGSDSRRHISAEPKAEESRRPHCAGHAQKRETEGIKGNMIRPTGWAC